MKKAIVATFVLSLLAACAGAEAPSDPGHFGPGWPALLHGGR